MTRILPIDLGIALAITLVAQGAPSAEAAQEARTAQGQKSAGGNDKGIAWVSGEGGTRGYSKAGKGLKAGKREKQIRNGRPIWVTDLTNPARTAKRTPPTITLKRGRNN